MSTSSPSLVNNLSDGLHSDKCTECKSCLDYMSIKDNQWNCIQWNCIEIIFKCLNCNKNYNKDFNKNLINRFSAFCNGDINKFILLLRKKVYPYEYMDSWKRFNETALPNKEDISLNMEDITDIDYRHAKKYLQNFK